MSISISLTISIRNRHGKPPIESICWDRIFWVCSIKYRGCSSVVERMLCMYEAPGSIPGISRMINFLQGTQVITELGKRLTSALEEPLKEVALGTTLVPWMFHSLPMEENGRIGYRIVCHSIWFSDHGHNAPVAQSVSARYL